MNSLLSRINWNSTREILPEPKFRNALSLERQRSERSGNILLLALVHLEADKVTSHHAAVVQQILDSAKLATRATDTLGWYKNEEVFGLIFTDLREAVKSRTGIETRIDQLLCAASDRGVPIRVAYHQFPESGFPPDPGNPIFYPETGGQKRRALSLFKRCIDVTGSLCALAVLSPLLVLIGLLVKLTSNGPVLCRQTRIGLCGKKFTFLKFRSMYHNNDPSRHREYVTSLIAGNGIPFVNCCASAVYKIVDDPRVTPIGKFLRRSSLDELPQLVNVLRGDMSLVGPRPPLPYEFECYTQWHRRRVLEAKPGLTGIWQITGRGRTNFDEMVRLDLLYIRNWSLWLDIQILLRTPRAVVSGTGAY